MCWWLEVFFLIVCLFSTPGYIRFIPMRSMFSGLEFSFGDEDDEEEDADVQDEA